MAVKKGEKDRRTREGNGGEVFMEVRGQVFKSCSCETILCSTHNYV